jgi:hypothetical protein
MQIVETRGQPEIKGVKLSPIHEMCKGCAKVIVFDEFDGSFCRVYRQPEIFWGNRGGCTMATHMDFSKDAVQGKVRAGQQKGLGKKKVGR